MPGIADLLRMQPFTASLNSHRILLYTLISTIAVSAAIANALKNHSNFYSVAIYLSKSNRSVLVLANFGLLLALLGGRVVQQIFFGPLRPAEVERLYDRLWFFVTESLLAFTIFRDDFDIPFALMFGFLLFVKSFHWLASDRIEWMDQRPYPGPPKLFHVRMNSLFLILWVIDFIMFAFAVESTVTNGVGGMVLFASEYAILMASALNTSTKYFLSLYELRRASQRGGENAPPWENKSMWVFYIELSTDFLKLTTYLVFFTLIITYYGLPLNIVRDVYITARSFVTRLRALQRYQSATRNMDQRYPNATEEEMMAMSDRTCIICREEMILRGRPMGTEDWAAPSPQPQPVGVGEGPNTTPKKLPCGHIFHFYCLRSWLERQQSCPTCRRTVLDLAPQGEGGQPGMPQVGAAPQAPNAFGVPGVQGAQPVPQQNNGIGGLAGRLFGAGVPGNAAQAQAMPAQFPGNLGFGQPGGPNNVLIQYNIQYQIARPQPQGAQQPQPQPQPTPQPVPQPPQQLGPPPIYNGFQGPGGAWQPWEIDPRLFGPAPQNQRRQPRAPSSTSTPTPTTNATPTSTRAQPETSPQTSSAEAPPNSTLGDNGVSGSTPREAAALAALRRSHTALNPPAGFTQQSSTPASPTANTKILDSLEANTSTSTSPSSESSSAWESSSESEASTTPNGSGPMADTHLKIPTMIPVYDFHRLPENMTPAGSSVRSPRTSPRPNGQASPYFRSVPRPRGQAPQQSPPTAARTHAATHAQLHGQQQPMRYQQPNAPRPPISQLPPTLTEAQLALMDRVTRDAIDERLRVLEGVSGAVFRCIEDLMRVRSSLPTPTTPTPGTISSAANPPAFASSSSNAAAVNQPSIVSASETLDEAIAGAREVAESSSKMGDSMATDLAQPSVAGSSNLQQEHQRPSLPSHPEAEPTA